MDCIWGLKVFFVCSLCCYFVLVSQFIFYILLLSSDLLLFPKIGPLFPFFFLFPFFPCRAGAFLFPYFRSFPPFYHFFLLSLSSYFHPLYVLFNFVLNGWFFHLFKPFSQCFVLVAGNRIYSPDQEWDMLLLWRLNLPCCQSVIRDRMRRIIIYSTLINNLGTFQI